MDASELIKRFDNGRQNGKGYSARCPAHDDEKNSLSVDTGDDGRLLLHCHAGCPAADVVRAVGLTLRDLMPSSNGNGKGQIVATYDYHDASGKVIYQAVRLVPKSFRQRQPDGRGGWLWHMKGVERVLYQLPELRGADSARRVFIVEGEKDCDRLRGLGLVATCNTGGADKWFKKYARELKGRHVCILPDNDKPGQQHARKVADSLHGTAASVKVIVLPGLEDKQDVSDWLDNGGSVEQLRELVAAAADYEPESQPASEAKPDDEGTIKLLADAICSTEHFAQDNGGKLYRYSSGRYAGRGEQFIKQRVKALCIAQELAKLWMPRLAENVVEFVRVDAPELWERPPLDVLNVQNGRLRLSDRKLLPPSPEHLSTVQLPVRYDPDASCPAIDKFIGEVFPDDAQPIAYQVPALLMLPDTGIQKAILLLGAGGNGKSVWLSLLVNFLGGGNVSALPLHKLESDRFAAARLIGKLANVCADLPTEHLSGTSTFKAVSGGDALTAEYKFRDSFDFTPFARLVFSANSPPRSQDASEGFFERWLVIPFEGKFRGTGAEIPKPLLDAQLSQPGELSGLLNRALDGLEAIRARGGRLHSCPSIEAAHREFHATTDPLSVWLDGFTVDDIDAATPKRVLRTAYGAVCEQAGRPRPSEREFSLALRQHRPDVADGQRTLNGRREHCFIGIGLRADDAHHAHHAQHKPYLLSPTNRVRARESEGENSRGENRTSKGQAVQAVQPVQQPGDGSYPLDKPVWDDDGQERQEP